MKNAFLFHIPSPSLRRKILQHELWRVGDSPFFVTEWRSEFSFNPPSLDRAPVWASIKGIPFDLITPEGLGIVCRSLGRAVDHKPFTSINSAEVKVVVDLTKPLPPEVELERDDGKILVLQVTYPWLPPSCSLCGEIGHKEALCPRVYGPENKPRAYGFDNRQKTQAKNRSGAPSSEHSQNPRKENFSSKQATWKPVDPSPKISPSKARQSSALPLVVVPNAKPSPQSSLVIHEEQPLSDKSSLELVVVDKPSRLHPKPLLQKSSSLSSPSITETSNPFDILQEDRLALYITDSSSKSADLDSTSLGSKKKRKVSASAGLDPSGDHPPPGVRHHTS
ncbi:unnamed protein product [Microthlaspi erraticum]|uniref:Uncharacterized protein n=1 Tax=Microthlaspi erraticum TaxID=1685480 RepID=A0A6D2KM49_9BRAS|nr:unnamed protein product [Microthlaspi erraticum]